MRMPYEGKKLTRGRGPLGLLEDIRDMKKLLGKWPTKKELMCYRTIKWDKTAQNVETLADMTQEEVIWQDEEWRFRITESGEKLLEKYGI